MEPETCSPVNDYEKQKKEVAAALKKLGKSSKLAAEAAKRESPSKSDDVHCRMLSALYYAAEDNYRKNVTNFKETCEELSEALLVAAGSDEGMDEKEKEVAEDLGYGRGRK